MSAIFITFLVAVAMVNCAAIGCTNRPSTCVGK